MIGTYDPKKERKKKKVRTILMTDLIRLGILKIAAIAKQERARRRDIQFGIKCLAPVKHLIQNSVCMPIILIQNYIFPKL